MRMLLAISTGLISRTRRSMTTFRRAEDGSMILLFIIFIVIMIPLVGFTITLNRTEHLRTRMQGTMDRAVLAAADIDQTLAPADVVMDYFTKAGLAAYIDPADIVVYPDTAEALRTGRQVSVCGRAYINTNITAIDGANASFGGEMQQWGTTTCSAAEEAKSDIEVMLVLDVSGSMNSSSRLDNLKVAAVEFVETVLTADTSEGNVGISIVPYAGQVNAETLLPYFPVTGNHTYGNCIDFGATAFGERELLPSGTTSLVRADVFDPWYSSKSTTLTYCSEETRKRILPMTNDLNTLRTFIQNLVADGNTSLDIGMKWGVGMMDPSFRPYNAQLISAGLVPSEFSDRPYDYNARSTAKFIILMSDGQNTDEYYLKDPYRAGPSPIWRDASGRLTIYHESKSGSSKYYRYDNSTWSTSPYSGSVQLNWPDVWHDYTINWVAQRLYDDPLGWSSWQRNAWKNDVRDGLNPSIKDSRTSQICTTAKQNGITVFTIGFEAPSVGNDALRDCATSPGHFFDVNGIEISEAFQTIARRISELRLTL